MQKRRRSKQTIPLKDRLAAFARETLETAALLPPGVEKEAILQKAREADMGSHIAEWINSPELQPPK